MHAVVCHVLIEWSRNIINLITSYTAPEHDVSRHKFTTVDSTSQPALRPAVTRFRCIELRLVIARLRLIVQETERKIEQNDTG